MTHSDEIVSEFNKKQNKKKKNIEKCILIPLQVVQVFYYSCSTVLLLWAQVV